VVGGTMEAHRKSENSRPNDGPAPMIATFVRIG
jgi:hypothetical protein